MTQAKEKFDDDLTIKKSDKYLPQIPSDVLGPVKERILKAIDNLHCTLPQIKRNAGFEIGEDISDILTALEETKAIVKVYNGVLTGYFRPEKVPSRFWLSGKNDRVGVDFKAQNKKVGQPKVKIEDGQGTPDMRHRVNAASEFAFRDNEWSVEFVRKLAEKGLTKQETAFQAKIPLSLLLQNLKNPIFKNAWDEGRRNLALGRIKADEVIVILPEAELRVVTEPPIPKGILNAPARNNDRSKNNGFAHKLKKTAQFSRTQEETAAKLGMSVHELNRKLRKDPELRAAYDRGRQNHKNFINNKNEEKSMQTQTNPGAGNGFSRKLIEVSESDVEKYASEVDGRTVTEVQRNVAEKLGMGWSTLMKKFTQNPELKKAYDRGREKFWAKEPLKDAPPELEPKEFPLEEISEPVDFETPQNNEVIPEIPNGLEGIPGIIEREVIIIPDPPVIPEINHELPINNSPLTINNSPNTPPHNSLEEPQEVQFVGHLLTRTPSEIIQFGNGGQIELFADLNLFKMDQESRDFVNQLIAGIQKFNDGRR